MAFDVILMQQANNGYLARPVLWPDTSVQGATRQEALERVQVLIRDLLSRTQLVQVEVDVPADHPWLAKAGLFATDPTWDDFIQRMADFRRHLDENEMVDQT
ncbi:MAG: hypothetical protein R2911_19225 [Caldilineaceae bacterium]